MSVTLLFDDFNGGAVDSGQWHYPTGPASYYGRTQIRAAFPTVSDNVVHLQLDTYNPTARVLGDSFFGSEIISNREFAHGDGLVFEFSGRLVSPVGGLVGGGFLYDYFPTTARHSEIDFELVSNVIKLNADNQVLINVYSNEPFGAGKPVQVSAPGLDVQAFNEYKIEWSADGISWHVNDHRVRVESLVNPSEPMAVHFNLWAPASDFALGYSGDLQPTASQSFNKTFYFDIDWVRVSDPIDFDGLDYIASYADLMQSFGANPGAGLQHFIDSGRNEGRGVVFNGLEYIASYADLMNAFAANHDAGASHYIQTGRLEARHVTFDGLEYIASYGDLISAIGVNDDAGASHYIAAGRAEGRHITFDGLEYIASYPDLINAFHSEVAASAQPEDIGSTHFILAGYVEHRSPDLFDAERYLCDNMDLQTAFGCDLRAATLHYITQGYFEGRTAHPLPDCICMY
jgi:beta-glucanase (GH16 family)